MAILELINAHKTLNDSAPVLSVDFSPDGENVASVNNSGIAALTLWSLAQSKGNCSEDH